MSDILMQIDLPGIGSHFKNFPMGFSWLFDPEVITVLICACMIVHPGRASMDTCMVCTQAADAAWPAGGWRAHVDRLNLTP